MGYCVYVYGVFGTIRRAHRLVFFTKFSQTLSLSNFLCSCGSSLETDCRRSDEEFDTNEAACENNSGIGWVECEL